MTRYLVYAEVFGIPFRELLINFFAPYKAHACVETDSIIYTHTVTNIYIWQNKFKCFIDFVTLKHFLIEIYL